MNGSSGRFAFDRGRREWLLRSGIAAGSMVLLSNGGLAASEGGISRTAEAIHQEVVF